MYLSLNWLKDFVDIPRFLTPEELALRLTMHTVEIDSVEKQAEKFANIVIGKILEIKKHPNANKLQLVKVDVGKIVEMQNLAFLQIVCGATNIKVGQFVPVALAGAVLPNSMEIKETEVRGKISQGMLCAEDELGLGPDHSGIMLLDEKAKAGQDLGKYLGLRDVVFEVDNKSITHRPDLWSHYGMAREISAFLNIKFKDIKIGKAQESKDVGLDVKVEDFKLCPRYMAIQVDNIKIEDSPKWMQAKLIAVGMRPINNIVDVTNYVLLELGQPLHAFDANLVNGIVVRRAKKGENMETLDGEFRELDEEMLVIADKKKPIAVAGVMGGRTSEISIETTAIIIESANFEPVQIRKTAQKLGLRTEASVRYEKSLDPNLCELAMARVLELIKKICPKARVVSNLVDRKKFELDQGPVELDLNWLDKIIGEEIEEKKVMKILTNLGFEIVKKTARIWHCHIPTWRATRDISISEDLVEEIARVYGYDNLGPQMPRVNMGTPEVNGERIIERKIKNILSQGAGLSETYNYSFVCEKQLKKLNLDGSNNIKLANPIADHQTLLRHSLVPCLLENIRLNQARHDEIGLFEVGSIFKDLPGDIRKDDKDKENLPFQEKKIGIVIMGNNKTDIFVRVKGIIGYLMAFFNLDFKFEPSGVLLGWADENARAAINVLEKDIGIVAKLNSGVARNLGIKRPVAIAEINFKELFELILNREVKKYREAVKYPAVVRDLAFVIDNKILYNDIKDEIENFSKLIKKVELFDVYSGAKLGKNKKNLAFHIDYQDICKTLTVEEIDKLQKKLIRRLEKKFSAQIRDF